jgi:hypothetical protein
MKFSPSIFKQNTKQLNECWAREVQRDVCIACHESGATQGPALRDEGGALNGLIARGESCQVQWVSCRSWWSWSQAFVVKLEGLLIELGFVNLKVLLLKGTMLEFVAQTVLS